MNATRAPWVKHPGFYIKEEMEERGWLQRDLAFVLGVPEQGVNLRDPLIFPYEINKTKPFLNKRLALEKFTRWRALN